LTRRPLLTAGVLLAALPASAAAQGISEFPLPAGSDPTFITTGHDGRLWFPLNGAGQIGRISINGALQQSVASQPNPIDIGPALAGGIVWSTPTTIQLRGATGSTTSHTTNHPSAYAVVATPANQVLWTQIAPYTPGFYASLGYSDIPFGGSAGTEELVPSSPSSPRLTDITVAPDHKLWLTLYEGAAILKTAASGAVEIRNDLAAGSLPYRIAVGPDGAMWFTEYGANRIGRVTNAGAVTEFDLPRPGVGPNDIVAGPDGALWFTEYNDAGNAIGRITTDGKVTEYPIPTATSKPWGIAAGPDGLIWFTEYGTDKIGRLDPSKAVPIGGGAGGGGGGAGADRTRPAFQGKVTLSRKRFSVGRAPTPFTVARAVPSGTQFRFSLSEPARVTVKIERRLSGRRVRGRCRTGAKSGRRCKLWRSAGRSLTRQGLQGPNSIAFSGRLGRKALTIGSYRARLTATDAAGNRSRTVTLGFRIVAKGR
jgi:virginiamycin B lyase